eukprot:366578-Chlamydomonas_euryale.AAC.3
MMIGKRLGKRLADHRSWVTELQCRMEATRVLTFAGAEVRARRRNPFAYSNAGRASVMSLV